MADRITTREAAIEEMLRWANGEKSHANTYGYLMRGTDPASIAAFTTECHRADAAEVQKWAAVAGTLEGNDTRPLLLRCASIIWKHEARPCDMMALTDYAEVECLAEDLRRVLSP
jgi:hypothetical protein